MKPRGYKEPGARYVTKFCDQLLPSVPRRVETRWPSATAVGLTTLYLQNADILRTSIIDYTAETYCCGCCVCGGCTVVLVAIGDAVGRGDVPCWCWVVVRLFMLLKLQLFQLVVVVVAILYWCTFSCSGRASGCILS